MLQMVFIAHCSKIVFTFKWLNCPILYKSLAFYQPESKVLEYGRYQVRTIHHTIVKVVWLDMLL